MKVLYSCLSRSWGGMEMFAITAVKELLKRNIECELLTYPNSKIQTSAEKDGLVVHPIDASSYFHPKEILKVKNIISENDFNIVHTQASKDLWVLSPAKKLCKKNVKLLMTKQVGSYIVKKDFLHKWIYKSVDLNLAISNVIKKNLLDTIPVDESKVKLLHNAVNTKRFDPEIINSSVRKEFNISDETIVIGMLARFSWGKGHEEVLHAAEILCKKYNNLLFMIIGEPSRGEDQYFQKIKNIVSEKDLTNNVLFTGYRSDTPEVLAALDIFAFPSHSEAFGIALAEAMSMGLPSVCSNSDGVLDIVIDNETSFLFEKQNSDDLADKLEKTIVSKKIRNNFGIAARKRIVENFDIDLLTDRVIEIYKELLNS